MTRGSRGAKWMYAGFARSFFFFFLSSFLSFLSFRLSRMRARASALTARPLSPALRHAAGAPRFFSFVRLRDRARPCARAVQFALANSPKFHPTEISRVRQTASSTAPGLRAGTRDRIRSRVYSSSALGVIKSMISTGRRGIFTRIRQTAFSPPHARRYPVHSRLL